MCSLPSSSSIAGPALFLFGVFINKGNTLRSPRMSINLVQLSAPSAPVMAWSRTLIPQLRDIFFSLNNQNQEIKPFICLLIYWCIYFNCTLHLTPEHFTYSTHSITSQRETHGHQVDLNSGQPHWLDVTGSLHCSSMLAIKPHRPWRGGGVYLQDYQSFVNPQIRKMHQKPKIIILSPCKKNKHD